MAFRGEENGELLYDQSSALVRNRVEFVIYFLDEKGKVVSRDRTVLSRLPATKAQTRSFQLFTPL